MKMGIAGTPKVICDPEGPSSLCPDSSSGPEAAGAAAPSGSPRAGVGTGIGSGGGRSGDGAGTWVCCHWAQKHSLSPKPHC